MVLIKTVTVLLSLTVAVTAAEISLRFVKPILFDDIHISRRDTNLKLHDAEHFFCTGPLSRIASHEIVGSREHRDSSYFELRNNQANFLALEVLTNQLKTRRACSSLAIHSRAVL